MTIQEAFQRAVEEGYHVKSLDGIDIDYNGVNDEWSVWTRRDTESSYMIPVDETFLDPKFWHALGRALGWDAPSDVCIRCSQGETCTEHHGAYWMYQWHCFIQDIANGKRPEEFFAGLFSTGPGLAL
jgi:hypothetical protein